MNSVLSLCIVDCSNLLSADPQLIECTLGALGVDVTLIAHVLKSKASWLHTHVSKSAIVVIYSTSRDASPKYP